MTRASVPDDCAAYPWICPALQRKQSEVERLQAALRDVSSLLEGFRCLNVLDAPVADLDGARERVRAALEEVETA